MSELYMTLMDAQWAHLRHGGVTPRELAFTQSILCTVPEAIAVVSGVLGNRGLGKLTFGSSVLFSARDAQAAYQPSLDLSAMCISP